VVAGIEQLHQPVEAPDAPGGRRAFGVEGGAQRGQQRRLETLAFQPQQHLGKQSQLVSGLFRRRHHGFDPLVHAIQKGGVDRQCGQENVAQEDGRRKR